MSNELDNYGGNDLEVATGSDVGRPAGVPARRGGSGVRGQTQSVRDYLRGAGSDVGKYDEGDDYDLQQDRRRGGSAELERSASRKPVEYGQRKPLSMWNSRIQSVFKAQPSGVQKAWLDSTKLMEKTFVKNLNEMKEDMLAAEEILSVVEPHYKDIRAIGMTPKTYMTNLIAFDQKLSENPAREIARLLLKFGITYNYLYKAMQQAQIDIRAEEQVMPIIAPIVDELRDLREQLGGVSEETERKTDDTADEVVEGLKTFFSQVDGQGEPLYPEAFTYMDDILELVQTGETLDSAYNLVMYGDRGYDEYGGGDVDYDSDREIANSPKSKDRRYLEDVANRLFR